MACSRWLELLDREPAGWLAFRAIYNHRADLARQKIAWLRRALDRFLAVFGDLPARIYRAPGRINLRGMHVDTHGGWLNLQAHHGETLVIAAVTDDPERRYVNLDPADPAVSFSLVPFDEDLSRLRRRYPRHDPGALLTLAGRDQAGQLPAWGRYLLGAALAGRFHGATSEKGLRVVVGSDLTRGASLSSSASLCVAMLLAEWDAAGHAPDPPALLHGARQAEWFAGARVGLSDQAAVVLARANAVLHAALGGPDLFPEPPAWRTMPGDATFLILHTFTSRSLSGSRRADYARNRFTYSMALRMLETEAATLCPEGGPFQFSTFPDVLNAFPSNRDRLRLIRCLPEELDLATLERRYGTDQTREEYDRLFGDLPESERPVRFAVRGPLLFGLAETVRARRFFEALTAGDLEQMGQLTRVGHDGDRVIDATERPFKFLVNDAVLGRWIAENRPLETCPGSYGASTPALDRVVDIATAAGALGACLTGAGLGGAAIALCRKEHVEEVRARILAHLETDAFQRARGPEAPPWPSNARETAVVENIAVTGAGVILPPSR